MEIVVWICAQPSLSDCEQSLDRRLYPNLKRIPFIANSLVPIFLRSVWLWSIWPKIERPFFRAHRYPLHCLLPCAIPSWCLFFCLHSGELFSGPNNTPPQFICGMNTACISDMFTRYAIYFVDMLWRFIHPLRRIKPFLLIPSWCIQTGYLAVLAQY